MIYLSVNIYDINQDLHITIKKAKVRSINKSFLISKIK